MSQARHDQKRGFSLLELVIVVVIIGILAAIAIPRMSRGTAGAADSTLKGDLAVMRNAIDLFAAEHEGKFPQLATITLQMTQYTDSSNTSAPVATKDTDHLYGPYLRAVPKLPLGANKNLDTFTATTPYGTDAAGWYYNENSGEIRANLLDGEIDATEKKYNTY